MRGVPCRPRWDEVDVGAGEDACNPKGWCEYFQRQYGRANMRDEMERVEPCGYGECGKGGEEEAEEEDFAGEPGAAPHLERSPGVGRAAEVEDRDVQGESGEREGQGEGDGAVMAGEECGKESPGGELYEGGHPDERPVGVFGAEGLDVDAFERDLSVFGKCDAGGGDGDSGVGHAGCVAGGVVAAPFKLIDDLDFDSRFGAGVDAGGFEAVGETAVAHVTLADDAALWVELRDGVRAIPDAILAADAGVG